MRASTPQRIFLNCGSVWPNRAVSLISGPDWLLRFQNAGPSQENNQVRPMVAFTSQKYINMLAISFKAAHFEVRLYVEFDAFQDQQEAPNQRFKAASVRIRRALTPLRQGSEN